MCEVVEEGGEGRGADSEGDVGNRKKEELKSSGRSCVKVEVAVLGSRPD